MNILNIIGIAAMIAAGSLCGDALSFQVGPFALEFGGPGYAFNRTIIDDPICYAISQKKKLEVVVKGVEKVSPKEIRIVTKKITIEPYAFKLSKDNQPVLRGNVVEEKLIKEVDVKYAEDKFAKEDGEAKSDEKKRHRWLF